MKKFLDVASALASSLLPKSPKLEIDAYGQKSAGLLEEEIQQLMQWLMETMMSAEYFGKAHLLFDDGNQEWNRITLRGFLRDEPVFLYRQGEIPSPPPEKCFWQLMSEHPSMRIYQLVAHSID
jgi:hypothetical protein